MTATTGFRNGRVRVLIADDYKGRAPVIHTVRGLGHAIRPVEDAR